jgi:predicted fused transcriptional regulator/phosphomethylpyrimidine kinase/predicted transcriptional regulator
MQPPCEIMVSDFLPNMRALVSHELHEAGESQRRIAAMLGITQARVSFYLARKKTQFATEMSAKFGIPQNDIYSYSKLLAEDVKRSQVEGIFTLYSIWKNVLFNGMACSLHQEKSGVTSDCAACMDLFKPLREPEEVTDEEAEDMHIIREISHAISMLEGSVQFPSIMPEVSVNIAMARRRPRTIRDVAAIPGRINKIHGRAKALVFPEFGASNHMSRVLLLANSRDSKLRSVINVKYDERIGIVLTEMGVPTLFTSEAKEARHQPSKIYEDQDPILARISQLKIDLEPNSPAVAVIDRGSEGVEPITYLIGKKATELAQLSLKIAQTYSSNERSRQQPRNF